MHAESVAVDDMAGQGPGAAPVALDLAELGPMDLVLLGNGWSIPVHRCCCTAAPL